MEACLLSFGKYWGTVCSVSRSGFSVWTLSLLMGTFLFFLYFIYLFFVVVGFYFCLSGIMCFSLLHHINSLRVSLEHSNPIFILRTEDPEGASVHNPHSLCVDTRLWGNSPLIIAVLAWILRWFLFGSVAGVYTTLWDCKVAHWINLWEGFLWYGNFSFSKSLRWIVPDSTSLKKKI